MSKEKMEKITILLLISSIIIVLISGFFNRNIEVVIRGISCAINAFILVLSVVSIKKANIYVFIISLFLTLFFGFATVSGIISNIKRNEYLNSEEFYIEQAKDLEKSLINSAKFYYEPEYYVENFNIGSITITKNQAEDNFDEKWFKFTEDDLGVCDGYIVINVNKDAIENVINNYKKRFNDDSYTPEFVVDYDYDGIMKSLDIKAFISCNGNYSYTTYGYNK